MKKLRKVRSVRADTVEAYVCGCGCGCSCLCNFFSCRPNDTLDHVSNMSRLLSNVRNSDTQSVGNSTFNRTKG